MIQALTENPYWDDIQLLHNSTDSYNIHRFEQRERYVHEYAWAIPDPEALQFVAKWLAPIAVEMGAGMGYWAWQLSQLGIDMLAFDSHPPSLVPNNGYHSPYTDSDNGERRIPQGILRPTFHPVEQGEPDVLTHYPDRTLFLCWPPYNQDMASLCLEAYTGSRLVYIGEGEGGCTGDDTFFETLDKEWEVMDTHGITQWDGMHDHIRVYERLSLSS